MERNAIVLAAGEGKRLLPYTENKPKPLVEVNGVSILENALDNLKSVSVSTVKIVVGHLGQVIKNKITNKYKSLKIEFVENINYKNNNSMYSLYLALLNERNSTFVIEGDIFFNEDVLKRNINDNFTWFTDSSINNIDGAYLKKDKQNNAKKIEIIRNINLINSQHSKSVGILYIPQKKIKQTIEILKQAIINKQENLYYDLIFADNLKELNISVLDINGAKWYEIDNITDLENAKKLFK